MKRVIVVAMLMGLIIWVADPVWGKEMGKDIGKATFGAGCFWGVEKVFGALDGVVSTQVGYVGGDLKDPTYEQVCSGRTGHAEAVEVTYDPSKIGFEDLVEVFFRHHDPTTLDRQGNDVGTQYRSVIFYHTPEQKETAQKAKDLLGQAKIFKKPVVTEIAPAPQFYKAEEYHQKYLQKNPHGYCHIQLQSAKIGEVLKTLKQ